MGCPAFSLIAEPLIVGVSFVVFAILDLVDRLLCVVFRALDSILDSDITTPCYCKHRVRGVLPQVSGPTLKSAQNLALRSLPNLLGDSCAYEDERGYSPSSNVACAKHGHGIKGSPSQATHSDRHPSPVHHCKSLVPQNGKASGVPPSFNEENACGGCPSLAQKLKESSLQAEHKECHLAHVSDLSLTNISCQQMCTSCTELSHDAPGTEQAHSHQLSRAKQGYLLCDKDIHSSEDASLHAKDVCGRDCLSHSKDVLANVEITSHAKHAHGSECCPPHAKDINGGQDLISEMHACGSKAGLSLSQSNSQLLCRTLSRWSDCGCSTCTSWQTDGTELLYVHVEGKGHENIIFIHGFLSSSALWSERVIPQLPHEFRASNRFFAVDLLGFGKSPKPSGCLYTMADHIKKIEESVLQRYNIHSFHLVAHSMGCIVALALAAAHVDSIRTITLVAPPYFPAPENEEGASYVLRQLAPRRIWPLTAFGASVMSWYEHVGRGICFVLCKQHSMWERVLSILTLNRIPRSAVCNFMQHTHHSAWHIFHNVICGEAHGMNAYLSILERGGCTIHVIHGKGDTVVPVQCSYQLEKQFRELQLEVLEGLNHFTVIYGREKSLALKLQKIWRPKESAPPRRKA